MGGVLPYKSPQLAALILQLVSTHQTNSYPLNRRCVDRKPTNQALYPLTLLLLTFYDPLNEINMVQLTTSVVVAALLAGPALAAPMAGYVNYYPFRLTFDRPHF
ncbi:hypothetical protein NLJ89_g9512 [Agrocybe chaxingu]|uniref:Uncharacterized protein n=1 Tax=Agrocybe chaxingu TaxID=84603 RepID=A0A9W8JT97_9AGAR|nr:hypothetical protein NLJ89_g9512 [Agrocybe chaxingu]